jgi:DNA-binding transcriptional regulator YhcF (GntR family)
MQPVKREFLKDTVAHQLRETIAADAWQKHLPSEVGLCRDLHVSRRTIRAAIAQLIREKWLRSRGRELNPVITATSRAASRPPAQTVIRYLSPRRREISDRASQMVENSLREFLGQEGFHLEFEYHPELYHRFSAKRMETLAMRPDTAAWILLHSTRGFLSSHGVKVPADAAVICRIDDIFLDFRIPSVAQYRIDCVKFGHACGALAVNVIRHWPGRSRHVKIVPEFMPGHTFGKMRK